MAAALHHAPPGVASNSTLPDISGLHATKLREALDGKNEDWFREIFTEQRCGSGGQKTVDGRFSRLFIKQPKGMREVTNEGSLQDAAKRNGVEPVLRPVSF
jgi:hypothetical protein